MALLAEVINRPITLQGQDVVIVPDLVGPVPVSEQHQYVELEGATNTCPSISVRESDIEDIRDRFPGMPVFGLWQILVYSGLISYRVALHVVEVNDYDGYYLHCDLGRAEFSGVFEAGFFAADSDFELEEAHEIDIDLNDLAVPEREAKLALELQAERRLKTQKSWRNLGIACAWIVMAGFGTDFGLQTFYEQEQKELSNKAQLLESLRSGLDQLRTSRLSEVPNDVATIKALAAVWAKFPNIQAESGQTFSDRQLKFKLKDEGFNPASRLDGITAEYDPQGFWLVVIENPKG